MYASDCPTADEDEYSPSEESSARVATASEGSAWNVAKAGAPRPAKGIEDLDFAECFRDQRCGAAFVFGNERRGVSRTMVEGADELFYLPMCGLTQSFNIGVALGMSLGMAARSGFFPTGSLSEDQCAELLGKWLIRDVKAARGLLAQYGIEFEDF